MHVVKILSLISLAIFLIIIGLEGFGFPLTFVHPAVTAFFALAAGVLFLIRGISCCCCCNNSCQVDHNHNNNLPK